MSDDSSTRNFALRDENGEEDSVFTGRYPRQAALKAARRLHPAPSEDEIDDRATLRLREHGTDKVHIYEGWAWKEEADEDSPDWIGDSVTKANVEKQGIKHLDE
ncbi:non-histone chromosomal MC1 family protein [Halalkalirubrum salinum]|uniref:non-histone chromosomal MC1 family protein n=1 Tax=Halalkalirubrum salinum TaxID=2563889 RepID=UPI0010FB9EEA|nr:non-histone chromosomal MC1 family protein [Halalkalirubrum salinum]